MVGNKNLRLLKILVPVVAVSLLVYVFYEYKQADNEVDVQKVHLRDSREEYRTLTKRFDMLSHELKTAVQATADLDKQLRLEKKSKIKLESEKKELERQSETEGVRRSNENNQLSKEKQQLAEEKVELNRERDRLSARVQSLAQEMTEQGDGHAVRERQLQSDCDTKLNQQTGKVTSLSDDLASYTSDLKISRGKLAQCKEEVADAAAKVQHHISSQAGANRYTDQRYKSDNLGYYGAGRDQVHDQRNYQREDHYNPSYNQLREGGRLKENKNKFHVAEEPRQQRKGYDDSARPVRGAPQFHDDREAGQEQKETHMDEKKKKVIYHSLHKKLHNGEELSEKQRRAYRLLHSIYGGLPSENHPAPNENHHMGGAGGLEARDTKKQGSQPTAHSEDAPVSQHEVKEVAGGQQDKKDAHESHAQLPPAPVNNNNDNNEQEEVNDLVQKLDSVKDTQKEVGAGEHKADQGGGAMMDDSVKDDAGADGDDDMEGKDHQAKDKNEKEEVEDQDQPLQKPVPEGGNEKKLSKEGRQPVLDPPEPVVGGNEDDEDVAAADYNKNDREVGEDDKNRVKEPAKHREGAEEDDGRQAFLHDQQEFERERLKNLQKEPRKGLAKEKQEQVKDMERELEGKALPNKRRREMR